MKNFMKKLAAGVLSLAMLLCSAVPVSAGSAEKETASVSLDTYLNEILPSRMNQIKFARSAVNIKDEIREYVEQTLPYYLTDFSSYNRNYTTTDLIPLNNWNGENEEKYIIVVSQNNSMIGTLAVEYTGDTIISSFREENISILYNAISNNTPFQLGYFNECFLIYTNNKFTILDSANNTNPISSKRINLNSEKTKPYSFSSNVTSAISTRDTIYATSPSVTNVSNSTHPQNDEGGLCWAACIAAMAMQAGNASSIGAHYVYNYCVNMPSSNKPNTQYPIGNEAWIMFAFEEIFNMNMIKKNALTLNQVISLLISNKPIYCSFQRIDSNGKKHGHAMVLWKYKATSGSMKYYFMDPGGSMGDAGQVSAIVPNGSNISITSRNGYSYQTWTRSIYEV